jgi:hypothetical protein
MKTFISMAVLCAATVTGTAQAADDDSGVIFGIGAGRTTLSADVIDFDDKVATYTAFAGWRFNKWLSIEGAYIDPQEATQDYGGVKVGLDAEIWQASLVGTYWFNDTFNVYARAGENWWSADEFATDGTQTISGSESGNEFSWGAGIGAVWDRALFRLEYQPLDVEQVDSSTISLSVAWRL